MRKFGITAACFAAVLLASGCSSGGTGAAGVGASKAAEGDGVQVVGSEAASDVTVNERARKLLPGSVREGGILKVGGETSLPPYLFIKGGQLTGVESEIMSAMGAALGLKVEVTNTKFAAMVTGLAAKRFDVAMSDFSDTLERQQQVTFVDYTQAGQILVVAAGNPQSIESMADLCGKSAAGPAGSLSVELAKKRSKECVKDGQPPVDVKQYPTGAETQLALQNGRVDAMAIDYAIGSYNVKEAKGKIELTGKPFALGYHGAAVRPEDKELQSALEAALNGLIDNGTYQRILDKWAVPQMAMEKVLINGTKE